MSPYWSYQKKKKKKKRLIIYNNKFKTSKLIIFTNLSLSTELLDRTNIIYMFNCPLGDCVSNEINKYVGLTTTTLSRHLIMHLNNSSLKLESLRCIIIVLHLKIHYFQNQISKNSSWKHHYNSTWN